MSFELYNGELLFITFSLENVAQAACGRRQKRVDLRHSTDSGGSEKHGELVSAHIKERALPSS